MVEHMTRPPGLLGVPIRPSWVCSGSNCRTPERAEGLQWLEFTGQARRRGPSAWSWIPFRDLHTWPMTPRASTSSVFSMIPTRMDAGTLAGWMIGSNPR